MSKEFDQVISVSFLLHSSPAEHPSINCHDFFCLKQVERAFSVCGTVEYMAPEIVEGGASGHDKVISAVETCCVSFTLLMAASCLPGSRLVEPRCFDV